MRASSSSKSEMVSSMLFGEVCSVVGSDGEWLQVRMDFDGYVGWIPEMYLRDLSGDNKKIITKFYEKLEKSHLVWINQNRPLGFGDAVKRAEKYVENNDFILHAGDVTVLSKLNHPVLRLIETAKKNPDVKAILFCKKVTDSKRYGVPTIEKISNNIKKFQDPGPASSIPYQTFCGT